MKLKKFEVEEISLLPFMGPKGLFLGGVPEGFVTSKSGFVCVCVCYRNLLHEFVTGILLQEFVTGILLQRFVT